MKTCAGGTKTTRTSPARSCLIRSKLIMIFFIFFFKECEETYPETKKGILQTSRLGIPHMHGSWNNALRLPSPSFGRACATRRHHQRTHQPDQPQRNLHGTHQSEGNLCCRRPTHLSLQRRSRGRERGGDAPLHRHVGLRRQIKVPRL